jgi:tRNA pseudouridine38/39 synthase
MGQMMSNDGVPKDYDDRDDVTKHREKKKKKKKKEFEFGKYRTRKIAIEIAYCGAEHFGFSSQGAEEHRSNVRTIEGALFEALKKCRLVDPMREIFGEDSVEYSRCGRTDRGVSSLGNIVSLRVRSALNDEEDFCDYEKEIDYVGVLNRQLPDDVRALAWYPVNDGFSSRFDCTTRTYEYYFTIVGGDGLETRTKDVFDMEAMEIACKKLRGSHDFRNFCKMNVKDCHDYKRDIKRCRISRIDDDNDNDNKNNKNSEEKIDFKLTIEGSSFLWHMVRCIAAVLFQVGLGADAPNIIDDLLDLEKTPRKPLYSMAPEHPLVLVKCSYDESILGEHNRKISDEALEGLEMHAWAAERAHQLKANLWRDIKKRINTYSNEKKKKAKKKLSLPSCTETEQQEKKATSLKRNRQLTRALMSSTYYGTAAGEPKGEPVSLLLRATERTYLERLADLNVRQERKKQRN